MKVYPITQTQNFNTRSGFKQNEGTALKSGHIRQTLQYDKVSFGSSLGDLNREFSRACEEIQSLIGKRAHAKEDYIIESINRKLKVLYERKDRLWDQIYSHPCYERTALD